MAEWWLSKWRVSKRIQVNESISMTIKNILISDKKKQKKNQMADSQQHLGSQSIHTDAMNQSYNSI